ncbi:MAG: 30S ribosomal protein THX [Bacteroidales bacterium]
MGKGDRKTRKGKIFRNTYGVRRPKKKRRMKKVALAKNPQENAPDLQDKMTDIKIGKEKEGSGKSTKNSKSKRNKESDASEEA